MVRQVKSRARVEERGEVFTNEREVNAMLDLVKQETERIDSRFLEPACGEGNFLAEILSRKLLMVKKKYKKSVLDYEKNAILAAGSIYGVDIMLDNVVACRARMFNIWDKEYKSVGKKECNDETRDAVKFILERNIVCGNALSLKCVDENGEDTDTPIVFSEWGFVTGSQLQRKDFTFDEILNGNIEEKENEQFDLFGQSEPSEEGRFLKQYISHYRKVREND